MAALGDTPISSNDNSDSSESSDEDEGNSTINRTETRVEQSTCSVQLMAQPQTNVMDQDLSDQQIDQIIGSEYYNDEPTRYSIIPTRYCGLDISFFWDWILLVVMGLTIGHCSYWLIVVLINLGIRVIRSILFPIWIYDSRFHIQLGASRPYTTVVNHQGQINNDIAHPSDSLHLLMNTYTFSTTIMEYFPLPRESIAVENNQPHNMPIRVVLNTNDQSHVANTENTYRNVDETGRNNINETNTPRVDVELPVQTPVIGASLAGIPNELPRDIDFAVSTIERQRNNQLMADRDKDEQRIIIESRQNIGGEDDLTSTNQCRGQASPNTKNNNVNNEKPVRPNQTNITVDKSAATELINDSSSPLASDNKHTVNVSTGDVDQSIMFTTPSLHINIPKRATPVDSSGESSEDNTD